MLEGFFSESILGRARESGAVRVACTDIRAYTRNKHRRVDDTPYGGGYGMVLACQPVVDCLRAVKSRLTGSVRTIYLSPQGGLFTHRKAKELASYDNLVLLCGHYEGVDERILELEVDEELSVGDYVLTGGELPAAIVVDAVARLVDGVLRPRCIPTRASSPGCWSIPSIRVRACSRGAPCPTCCWAAIMKRYGNGGWRALLSGRSKSGPSCWNC